MSAIAHFLEDEGIATTLIALIRLHVSKSRPPRALWVPFQLGRPLGPPLDPVFQSSVLRAALALLESKRGSAVLEDFPREEPCGSNEPEWKPPAALKADSVAAEVDALMPWYEQSKARSARTTVGITGFGIRQIAAYLSAVDTDKPPPNPSDSLAPVQMLRFAVDDLKAFYLEAVAEASEAASGWQFANWFWTQTHAGALVRALHANSLDHPDAQRRMAAWWLVPDGWVEREIVERTWRISYKS